MRVKYENIGNTVSYSIEYESRKKVHSILLFSLSTRTANVLRVKQNLHNKKTPQLLQQISRLEKYIYLLDVIFLCLFFPSFVLNFKIFPFVLKPFLTMWPMVALNIQYSYFYLQIPGTTGLKCKIQCLFIVWCYHCVLVS